MNVPTAFIAGVNLLDSKLEEGWALTLDETRLDISDPYDCVLGQYFGSFTEGLTRLDVDFESSCYYGFNAMTLQNKDLLTAMWRELITYRKNIK